MAVAHDDICINKAAGDDKRFARENQHNCCVEKNGRTPANTTDVHVDLRLGKVAGEGKGVLWASNPGG